MTSVTDVMVLTFCDLTLIFVHDQYEAGTDMMVFLYI